MDHPGWPGAAQGSYQCSLIEQIDGDNVDVRTNRLQIGGRSSRQECATDCISRANAQLRQMGTGKAGDAGDEYARRGHAIRSAVSARTPQVLSSWRKTADSSLRSEGHGEVSWFRPVIGGYCCLAISARMAPVTSRRSLANSGLTCSRSKMRSRPLAFATTLAVSASFS